MSGQQGERAASVSLDLDGAFDLEGGFDAATDPMRAASALIARARRREPFDVTAMSLATVDETGRPSVRMVLLKGIDARGFTFFTNRESRKARELDHAKVAALCLHYPGGEEQIRAEGRVERAGDDESDAYFATRGRASQLGAWASLQSAPLASRDELLSRFASFERKFEGGPVPRPPHWGGYHIVPDRIELWFGRKDRLHDRFVYTRTLAADGLAADGLAADGAASPWAFTRLNP